MIAISSNPPACARMPEITGTMKFSVASPSRKSKAPWLQSAGVVHLAKTDPWSTRRGPTMEP